MTTRKARRAEEAKGNVVVVGGGFAGVACAKVLAKHGVHVTLIDRRNYHQFQPMLYQVATAQLASSDIAAPLRGVFQKNPTVDVKYGEVTTIDPQAKTAKCADGASFTGDYLVLATGTQPNFFGVPGAEEHAFPLYCLDDAERLRTRIFTVFNDADRRPSLIDQGALTFVIIGAGATGVETAGALADLVAEVMPTRYRDLDVTKARVVLVDPAPVVLAPFSDHAHAYAEKVLSEKGVEMRMGVSASEIGPDSVRFSDGTDLRTRTVVWAGGIQASPLAANAGLPQGRGGRIGVEPDLRVAGFPGIYALGDVANTPAADGTVYPQLGSVALQAGRWAADNILAEIDGKETTPFRYHDKGIMAMIGRNAAVAEMGEHRHELHGSVAFAAWLGVHAWLLSGVRERIDAFVSWGWDYFSSNRASSIIDRPDAAQIDWDDDEGGDSDT